MGLKLIHAAAPPLWVEVVPSRPGPYEVRAEAATTVQAAALAALRQAME